MSWVVVGTYHRLLGEELDLLDGLGGTLLEGLAVELYVASSKKVSIRRSFFFFSSFFFSVIVAAAINRSHGSVSGRDYGGWWY